MRDRLAKLLGSIGEVLSSGGISMAIKNYSELEEARLREDCRIIHEGTRFQKILFHIATGGIHICYRK